MDGRDLAIDRISDLPDPLLTQVLSLLTTEEAVRTCILSKRWTDLWTSIDTLEFDSGYGCENRFLRLVHGVLNRRGFSPLDKFKLTWRSRSRSNHRVVEEFINHAIACMPRIIYIYSRAHNIFDLPDSFFKCGSIKEMSLLGDYSLWKSQPKSINLPSLQKLELSRTSIDDDLIKMFLLECPVLEELVLTSCLLMINEINSNVLKKLTMKECLLGLSAKSITLNNASSLVTADLEISYADKGLNLLAGLPNVACLRLYTMSRYVLGLLNKDIPNCPMLNNLTNLELGEFETIYDWNLVTCFLHHSPNLKKLVVNFSHCFSAQEALLEKNSFLREFLEVVEMRFKIESEETVINVVATLGALVKTIGKIIII